MATTSFLYHTLGLKAHRHLKTEYCGGKVFHHVELRPDKRRCRACGWGRFSTPVTASRPSIRGICSLKRARGSKPPQPPALKPAFELAFLGRAVFAKTARLFYTRYVTPQPMPKIAVEFTPKSPRPQVTKNAWRFFCDLGSWWCKR